MTRPRYWIFTDAGKPVFCSSDEHESVRLCGFFQAMISSMQGFRSLVTESQRIVMKQAGSLTLVGMGGVDEELWLSLQLEYLHSLVVFAVTNRIQSVLQQNASFDLQSMLGSQTTLMTSFLEDRTLVAPMLLGAVPILSPMDHLIRNRASEALRSIRDDSIVFAILFVDNRLVTMVQPAFREHQMPASDLVLLLRFLQTQDLNSECWLPVCLPRFHCNGFLHCYATHLEGDLHLALLTQSVEQLPLLREAGLHLRRRLGISRDDYVDASGDGDQTIPYVSDEDRLLSEIRAAKAETLSFEQGTHLMVRWDASIGVRGTAGHLCQCLVSGDIISSDLRVAYAKLSLRMRLGAASDEAWRSADVDLDHMNALPECSSMKLIEAPCPPGSCAFLKASNKAYAAMRSDGIEM